MKSHTRHPITLLTNFGLIPFAANTGWLLLRHPIFIGLFSNNAVHKQVSLATIHQLLFVLFWGCCFFRSRWNKEFHSLTFVTLRLWGTAAQILFAPRGSSYQVALAFHAARRDAKAAEYHSTAATRNMTLHVCLMRDAAHLHRNRSLSLCVCACAYVGCRPCGGRRIHNRTGIWLRAKNHFHLGVQAHRGWWSNTIALRCKQAA